MFLTMLKGKIHRAVCSGADLHYNGSITIDPDLLEAAGIIEHEQVDVLDITNGNRLTTYAIPALVRGGGEITINGAAAHLVEAGHLLIICAYAHVPAVDAAAHRPKVVLVDSNNKIANIADISKPGLHIQPEAGR
jgi:aspartate 1-decarboxylase